MIEVQLDANTRKNMIMCPGTDTKSFRGSDEGEPMLAGFTEAFL